MALWELSVAAMGDGEGEGGHRALFSALLKFLLPGGIYQ